MSHGNHHCLEHLAEYVKVISLKWICGQKTIPTPTGLELCHVAKFLGMALARKAQQSNLGGSQLN